MSSALWILAGWLVACVLFCWAWSRFFRLIERGERLRPTHELVCAWCQCSLPDGEGDVPPAADGSPGVSHGICATCAARLNAEAEVLIGGMR